MSILTIILPKMTEDAVETHRQVANCGGIGLFMQGTLSFTKWKKGLPEVCQHIVDENTTHCILIMEELVDFLSPQQLQAVILHEKGHYALNHIKPDSAGIIVNEDYEFEADAYAAAKVGSDVVISALKRMPKFLTDVTLPKLNGYKYNLFQKLIIRVYIRKLLKDRIAYLKTLS